MNKETYENWSYVAEFIEIMAQYCNDTPERHRMEEIAHYIRENAKQPEVDNND